MSRTFTHLAMLFLSAAMGSTNTSATTFSVEIDSPPDPNAPYYVVENPLYKQGSGGQNPLFEPLSIYFVPSQLWQGQSVQFVVNMDDALPSNLPAAPNGGFVFEASLNLVSDGSAIHNLAQPVQIGLDTGNANPETFDFGYFDPTTGQWTQQSTTQKVSPSFWCGTTNHFSVFYVAPVPEPASCGLVVMGILCLGLAYRSRAFKLRG